MGVQIPPWEGAILRGKEMPADLSPLAKKNFGLAAVDFANLPADGRKKKIG